MTFLRVCLIRWPKYWNEFWLKKKIFYLLWESLKMKKNQSYGSRCWNNWEISTADWQLWSRQEKQIKWLNTFVLLIRLNAQFPILVCLNTPYTFDGMCWESWKTENKASRFCEVEIKHFLSYPCILLFYLYFIIF